MTGHLLLLPIFIPFVGAAIALLLRKNNRREATWSLIAMSASLLASILLFAVVWRTDQPLVFQSGNWPAPFGITLIADLLAAIFVVMIQLVVVMGIVYAIGSRDSVVRYPAFYVLFLMLAAGLTGAILTGDLFNFYVFVELVLISGSVLTAIADHQRSTEAAYKYMYLSLLASFFILLGIGALYVSYGTLNMADLAAQISTQGNRLLLMPAIALLFAAFMVKSAIFPFHFWQPDLYMTAPTAVGAVLSSVVGKLGVYGFLRMTTLLFVAQAPQIRSFLIVLGVAGVIFGGLSAIGTNDVKRMLAYSSMAQIGFITVAIGWGTEAALMAAIVFAFNHALIKSAMIMIAGFVASWTPGKSAAFQTLSGAGRSLPAAGVLFFIGGLALSGIPPTNGFISKMLLFGSGIDGAYDWSLLLIGLASILTLIYTVRAFNRIWWQKAASPSEVDVECPPAGDRLIAPAFLIGCVLVLGIWAQPLVRAAEEASTWLGDPGIYIRAVLGG
ncbi:MAG: proton-conducting transporter membrane subunit [Chloroflexota bacterium]|nr:proton-conducting transporter membrane subunit [Chloroflexota bacterium]